jgi:hypothetical protein
LYRYISQEKKKKNKTRRRRVEKENVIITAPELEQVVAVEEQYVDDAWYTKHR